MRKGKVTERTFYRPLSDLIGKCGGTGVEEVKYNSSPDIQFELKRRRWLLSVKIGETPSIIKQAFVQYVRHKEESGIEFGLILFLPEIVRATPPQKAAVFRAARVAKCSVIIDAGPVKEELRNVTFPELIRILLREVIPRVSRKKVKHYPLPLVISLLRQHVQDVMKDIDLSQSSLLHIITNKNLLMDLGHLAEGDVEDVARFLGGYILLSQILFLRLLVAANPGIITHKLRPITPAKLHRAFRKILSINYRPIYSIHVLDSVSADYVADTFDLIWGLQIENIHHDLPGRIFHELMPGKIRKLLAAFYTRPQAADLLARLTIRDGTETVFDPACGSGTILVSAYRQKAHLSRGGKSPKGIHRTFCEREIFGCDIMPFAVHLTSANLAAIDPATTIRRTQIIQADSLKLQPDKAYDTGLQMELFPQAAKAKKTSGKSYPVPLHRVDTVLMNPPFTKTERGIRDFVHMSRFEGPVGKEIGLWGHFLALAELFLKDGGLLGAVIPINILRGRESDKVRKTLFQRWAPLYVIKATHNYAFSESAEYRDILLVARKGKKTRAHRVKFCLVKKELNKLDPSDIAGICSSVRRRAHVRSELLDINSEQMGPLRARQPNMMWFVGGVDFSDRDLLVRFNRATAKKLAPLSPAAGYCRTGHRTTGGLAKIVYLTRTTQQSRTEKAFLRFSGDGGPHITATSPLGAKYVIPKKHLLPTLRTPVGVGKMDVTAVCDYVAVRAYPEVRRVARAAGMKTPGSKVWATHRNALMGTACTLMVSRRINPFSAENSLVSFFATHLVYPSDQLNVIAESDTQKAEALCAVLNSIVFFAQFFMLKEESTGRFIDIRVYDLYEMLLVPQRDGVQKLARVFRKFKSREFPGLRNQFDRNFDQRYDEYWKRRSRPGEPGLFSVLDEEVDPHPIRLGFDRGVCSALGVSVSNKRLRELYGALVREMMVIRHLTRD